MMHPIISAVVCTYNRSEDLRECLDSLINQSFDDGEYEIVIIDNNSTDNTVGVVREAQMRCANLHYFCETKQGLAAARNCALREVKSDIVCFTDDDACPQTDWLHRIYARFQTLPREVVAVGGDVTPLWGTSRPTWLSDELLHPLSAGLKWSSQARSLVAGEWLIEVNVAYRKSILSAYGGFPEHLGRIGVNLLSGENAINLILEADRYSFFFDPEILVTHKIAKERLSKAWFRRRYFWQGVTNHFVQQYVRDYINSRNNADHDYDDLVRTQGWFSLELPAAPHHWAELFDAKNDTNFITQLRRIEGLGYLLTSQSLIVGR